MCLEETLYIYIYIYIYIRADLERNFSNDYLKLQRHLQQEYLGSGVLGHVLDPRTPETSFRFASRRGLGCRA